ncbi:MAG: PEP-CTERM sorting domain-containing protein [Phycisphaerae bacterium]
MIRFCTALLVVGLCAGAALAASPPAEFESGNNYNDTYVTTNGAKHTTLVTGGGTAWFSGFWDARRSGKTLWKGQDSSRLYINAGAEFDNNFNNVLYASNFQVEGDPNNVGSANEIFEYDAGFDADRSDGSISIGDVLDDSYVGGMTTMRVHNARLVTHASQNLATAFKATTDTGAWNPNGDMITSHHGLLIFSDIMDHDGTTQNTPATSSEWHVRSNDQTYDGGLYWKNDWTLDVEAGVTLSSNTHFEQAAVGPHVGFGTRSGDTNTTLTKTGDGALVIARGGIQGYETGTTLDIQAGRVEFNSNEATNNPNYYCGGNGQTLNIDVAAGAEVDFHAYSYPIENNWYTGSSYGPESTHEIKSLDAAGTVKLGGLWSPSSDQWDTDYYNLFEAGTSSPTGYGPDLRPETANAGDAKLDLTGDLTLAETSLFKIILGADSAGEDWQALIGGTFSQAGDLQIVSDGTLDVGTYDLFDADTFSGSFANLVLPTSAWDGSYDETNGILSVTAVPEPMTLAMLGIGSLAVMLKRKRR